MPELDSHHITPSNPEPLTSQFSPWHGCGPDYTTYSAGMKRCAHLQLVNAVCRLAPDDSDTDAALQQWEDIFGVPRTAEYLQFTNSRMGFVGGREGMSDGLVSVSIAVDRLERIGRMLGAARSLGLACGDGWVDMLGVRWYFVHADARSNNGSRL